MFGAVGYCDAMAEIRDVLEDNQNLFSLLFAHQIYLEGVRSWFATNFNATLTLLYKEFQKFVGEIQYDTIDAFTKAELETFIRRFQRAQLYIFSSYTQQLILLLQRFLSADVDVARDMYANTTGLTPEQANAKRLAKDTPHAMMKNVSALSGSTSGNATLWANIVNDPVPGNGMLPAAMIDQFTRSSTTAIIALIRMGYANNWTKSELIAAVSGTKSNNYRDGYFMKLSRQNDALVGTLLQHITSVVYGAIGAAYSERYQWCSVMDNHTTEICISRNGKVYIIGKGPFPPAHWGCRSRTVTLFDGIDDVSIPASFYLMLAQQPLSLLSLLLGGALATKIRAGQAKTTSLSDITTTLTIPQFASKMRAVTGALYAETQDN